MREEENPLTLVMAGMTLFGALGGGLWAALVAWGQEGMLWLVEHNVLVPADQAVLTLGEIGGLDMARIVLIILAVLMLLTVTVMAALKIRDYRRKRALRAMGF